MKIDLLRFIPCYIDQSYPIRKKIKKIKNLTGAGK
jgi:hypothetical protein